MKEDITTYDEVIKNILRERTNQLSDFETDWNNYWDARNKTDQDYKKYLCFYHPFRRLPIPFGLYKLNVSLHVCSDGDPLCWKYETNHEIKDLESLGQLIDLLRTIYDRCTFSGKDPGRWNVKSKQDDTEFQGLKFSDR